MFRIVKLTLALIIISSCSCRHIIVEESEIKNDHFYYNGDTKPFSGACLTYFPKTHVLKAKRMFNNGILNGETITYYNNGQQKMRGTYKDGKYHGQWREWFADGQLAFDANHEHGLLNGQYISYHENGNIKEEGQYKENKKAGEWNFYNADGKLMETVVY